MGNLSGAEEQSMRASDTYAGRYLPHSRDDDLRIPNEKPRSSSFLHDLRHALDAEATEIDMDCLGFAMYSTASMPLADPNQGMRHDDS